MKEVIALIRKDFTIEWRLKYAINGTILYLVSTIFIAYLSFSVKQSVLSPQTWNALFWIIILFVAVSAVAKSFLQESQGRTLYYYQLASPVAIIISKIIYNALLMIILAILGFIIYTIVVGNPLLNQNLFLLNVLLTSVGFSSALSMISAIVSKANNNATLMAILSFPILIPILLMSVKVSAMAIDGFSIGNAYRELLVLVAINMIIVAVSYLLFPYLWRS